MANEVEAGPSRNLIMPDTNILIQDPNAIDFLRSGGNVVVLAGETILELDKLKGRPDIGFDAREAIKKIEALRKQQDKSLIIEFNQKFGRLNISDHNKPDHVILATFNKVLDNVNAGRYRQDYGSFGKVKFISNDATLRLLIHHLLGKNEKVVVEDYHRDKIRVEIKPDVLRELKVSFSDVDSTGEYFTFTSKTKIKEATDIVENEGVVCLSNYNPETGQSESDYKRRFVAIKKGDRFKIIDPSISASGITSLSNNGNGPNWQQQIALAQLLDKSISCCFLQGGAGTGKTLLAIAAALKMKGNFRQILISRPMVSLEDEDKMGYLPGGINNKMSPWMLPIIQNLQLIETLKRSTAPEVEEEIPPSSKRAKKKRGNNGGTPPKSEPNSDPDLIGDIFSRNKMINVPLDYIRGATWIGCIVIIDEAQNLTAHQMKTIITRVGQYSKIIFTGDLGQIDRKKIPDFRSSGMAYAAQQMKGSPMVSVVNFSETVRSALAALAEKVL